MTQANPTDTGRPIDDPKLTAYALGELDDAESRAMRQRIVGDDEANAYVQQVRAAGATLRGALQSQAATDADVERLTVRRAERSLHADEPAHRAAWRWSMVPAALAAALAVAATVSYVLPHDPAGRTPTNQTGPGQPGAAIRPVAQPIDMGPLVELEFDTPNPAFAGTPKVIPDHVNVDRKTLGKQRGPFMLPKSIVDTLANVALDKKVASSDPRPIIGELDQITDGDKEALDGRMVELAPGKQWVRIDLGKPTEVFAVLAWHNHLDPRVYRDVVVQVAEDEAFTRGVATVFNNDHDNSSGFGVGEAFEYFESFEGKLVDCTDGRHHGTVGRYVRLWSKGSTADDANHYGEVEVWGRDATGIDGGDEDHPTPSNDPTGPAS